MAASPALFADIGKKAKGLSLPHSLPFSYPPPLSFPITILYMYSYSYLFVACFVQLVVVVWLVVSHPLYSQSCSPRTTAMIRSLASLLTAISAWSAFCPFYVFYIYVYIHVCYMYEFRVCNASSWKPAPMWFSAVDRFHLLVACLSEIYAAHFVCFILVCVLLVYQLGNDLQSTCQCDGWLSLGSWSFSDVIFMHYGHNSGCCSRITTSVTTLIV